MFFDLMCNTSLSNREIIWGTDASCEGHALSHTNFPPLTQERDLITVYEDEGATLASLNALDYPDLDGDPANDFPTPSDTFAHVYQGDPLADGVG